MYEEVLIRLSGTQVRYLVVGAVALGLRGYPRATVDLDILPELTDENLDRLITVLRDLGYKPVMPVEWADLKDPEKRRTWHDEKHMIAFSAIHHERPENVVDIILFYPEGFDFEACYRRKETVRIRAVDVHLACLEDLLELKKDTGREKDRADIQVIEQMIRARDIND